MDSSSIVNFDCNDSKKSHEEIAQGMMSLKMCNNQEDDRDTESISSIGSNFGSVSTENSDPAVAILRQKNLECVQRYLDAQSKEEELKTPENLVVDHFGFIISKKDDRDKEPLSKVHSRLQTDEFDEQKTMKKWTLMIQNWDLQKDKVIRRRVFRGIPDTLRCDVWNIILGLKKKKELYDGVYKKLVKLSYKTSTYLDQIDKDVARTLCDHSQFRSRYGKMRFSLFNVLAAYSCQNPVIGYTQGMSEIAGFLLLCLKDEEDCFLALSHLMTEPGYCMHGLFMADFEKYHRFNRHQELILKTMLPTLVEHFENMSFECSLYTIKWFLRCFILSVEHALLLRIWDIFIYLGDKIMHPIAYTILSIHKKTILKLDNIDEVNIYIQQKLPVYKYNISRFMKEMEENIDELRSRGLYPVPSTSKTEISAEYSLSDHVSLKNLKEYHRKLDHELKKSVSIDRKISGDNISDDESVILHHSTISDSDLPDNEIVWGIDPEGCHIPPPPNRSPPAPPEKNIGTQRKKESNFKKSMKKASSKL